MKRFTILLIALALSLMLASAARPVRRTSRPRQTQRPVSTNQRFRDSGNSGDEYFNAVCTSADRNNRNCFGGYTMGCLCFNNGTCKTTQVNRCSDCAKPDVFSSMAGQSCSKQQPYLCTPPIPGKKYSCPSNKTNSCVCTVNGTCTMREASHCIDCMSSPNTLAVFEGKDCPAKFLQAPPSKYFIPKVCEKTDAKSISCLKTTTAGCVCYSNSTCEYRTDSNRCLMCFDKNVVSFNQGEYCPRISGKLFVCGAEGNAKCGKFKNSCVCTTDGTCNMYNTNHCKGCDMRDAASVVEGGQCPLARYISDDSAVSKTKWAKSKPRSK